MYLYANLYIYMNSGWNSLSTIGNRMQSVQLCSSFCTLWIYMWRATTLQHCFLSTNEHFSSRWMNDDECSSGILMHQQRAAYQEQQRHRLAEQWENKRNCIYVHNDITKLRLGKVHDAYERDSSTNPFSNRFNQVLFHAISVVCRKCESQTCVSQVCWKTSMSQGRLQRHWKHRQHHAFHWETRASSCLQPV